MGFLKKIFKKDVEQREIKLECDDNSSEPANELGEFDGNAIAELDRAANDYAKQLEKAANSVGYSVKPAQMEGGDKN